MRRSTCILCAQKVGKDGLCTYHYNMLSKEDLFKIECKVCKESWTMDMETLIEGSFNCACGMKEWKLKGDKIA